MGGSPNVMKNNQLRSELLTAIGCLERIQKRGFRSRGFHNKIDKAQRILLSCEKRMSEELVQK